MANTEIQVNRPQTSLVPQSTRPLLKWKKFKLKFNYLSCNAQGWHIILYYYNHLPPKKKVIEFYKVHFCFNLSFFILTFHPSDEDY